jgi:hypothetical protein
MNKIVKVKLRNGKIIEGITSESRNNLPQVTILVPGFDIDYTFDISWGLLNKAVHNKDFEIRF